MNKEFPTQPLPIVHEVAPSEAETARLLSLFRATNLILASELIAPQGIDPHKLIDIRLRNDVYGRELARRFNAKPRNG